MESYGVDIDKKSFGSKHGEKIQYVHDCTILIHKQKNKPQSSYAYQDAVLGEFRPGLIRCSINSSILEYILRRYIAEKLPEGLRAKY